MLNSAALERYCDLLATKQRRRKIRSSLTEWARCASFEPAAHHRLLIEKLGKLVAGDIKRLMVFMPPGSAKSTYASVLTPAFFLANHPKGFVIAASHSIELADKFGRRVRNLVSEYHTTLDIELQDDNRAAGRWATVQGGEYYAAGVRVGISGFRADLAIIDDPIRNREDADSQQIRDKIWEWYKSDLSPRLRPGARIALIQTRWHEDDLAGRLLEEHAKGISDWHIVSLPAEAGTNDPLGRKPGELLWADDDYGYADFLRSEKASQTPRNWSALYQQEPAPEGGNYFKAEWLRPYEHAPDRSTLSIYGASDYAVTADGGDYTVHLVVGLDELNRLWLLDMWRGQTDSSEWVTQWCRLVKQWKPLDWAEETGQITAGVGPFRDSQALAQGAFTNVELFPTRGDKAVRAQSVRGRMAMGGLFVPTHASWFADFRAELLSFDAGKHDDQVDALGLVGQLLDRMVPGRMPKEETLEEKNPSGYKAVEEIAEGIADWKTY